MSTGQPAALTIFSIILLSSPLPRSSKRVSFEQVSWFDTEEFIRKLNGRQSGKGFRYRLPTEAEWEYAARAGTTSVRYGELGEIAWYADNSEYKTHPVGQKRANAWGLHDMLGNVWEWTADWYADYPTGPAMDPRGPRSGSTRVSRGTSWRHRANSVRSAHRHRISPDRRSISLGFRLVRTG